MTKPTTRDLSTLPGMQWQDDGPVFNAPWQAQAFALTLKLHEQGYFTWPEWADALAAAITAAQAQGDPDLGDTYYEHWLSALEQLVQSKDLTNATELAERKSLWDKAVRNTPHGQPIRLANAGGPVSVRSTA